MSEAKKNEIILNVDTGFRTVRVMDGSEVIAQFKFNPADSNIVSRLDSVIDFFNGVRFTEDMTEEQTFDRVKQLCVEIGEQFDYLFSYKVSDGLFANCGPLSVTESGDFFFEVMLEEIGKVIESTMHARIDRKLKKVKKATSKYHQ